MVNKSNQKILGMKKNLLITIMLGLAVSFVSCTKECESDSIIGYWGIERAEVRSISTSDEAVSEDIIARVANMYQNYDSSHGFYSYEFWNFSEDGKVDYPMDDDIILHNDYSANNCTLTIGSGEYSTSFNYTCQGDQFVLIIDEKDDAFWNYKYPDIEITKLDVAYIYKKDYRKRGSF